MSIQVQGLSYAYAQHQVLEDLSFEASEGKIVGLLGVNGAGKSTLMRLLVGYLPVPPQTLWICQKDMSTSHVSIRRKIGYLPEHNPLYEDMYVPELLRCMGELQGLRGKVLREQTEEVIQSCGLESVRKKQIQVLSKGYKQRVGLARALIHQPKVLVLDEPTNGLDPQQLVHIRKLLQNLSQKMCILLSTHVLQEVEAICHEVILLHHGKILKTEHLHSSSKVDSTRTQSLEHLFHSLSEKETHSTH